jgi:serine/threonine-protein kinase
LSEERETKAQRPGAVERRTLYGDELSSGALVGEYRVESTLAHGGCGTVYVARHEVIGRRAALKVLHQRLAKSPQMVERFVREARAVNRIGHPHIVDIYELGSLDDGRPYYVMELIDGIDLRRFIGEHGRVSPEETLAIIAPVCEALDAAHRAGIIHRDLKASNVLIADRAGTRVVKLHDFGIAKLVEPERDESGFTSVGERLGSPHSMAPEQIRGVAVDARTDVYALGILLYQLLTGQVPFEHDDPTELERMHLEQPAPRTSASAPVPPAIDAAIQRCLEKDPERRFADVPAVLHALRVAARDGRATTRGSRCQLSAIYLAVTPLASATDDLFDLVADVLEEAEHRLRAQGYSLALRIGETLLGVKALPDEPAAALEARRTVVSQCRALASALAALAGDEPVAISACLHAGRAVVRDTTVGVELIGGEISELAAWTPAGNPAGLYATTAALAGLREDAGPTANPSIARLDL